MKETHVDGNQSNQMSTENDTLEDYLDNFHIFNKKQYKVHGSREPEDTKQKENSKMTDYWKKVYDGIGKNRQLYQSDFNVEELLFKMQTETIVNIDFFRRRPTIKWILTLTGGQKVLFKPELNDKQNHCKSGCEHPEYEVTGYVLNRMLGLNTMPFATGRELDWFTEIEPIASKDFIKAFNFYRNKGNKTKICIKWTCSQLKRYNYCFSNGRISGAVIYWVNRDILELRHYSINKKDYTRFHPMYFHSKSRTMKVQNLQTGDSRFCDKLRQLPPFNITDNFIYILDMAVEDFLTQSKNSKHNIIYLDTSENRSMNVVIDKGKGFCHYKDDLLLAPIYQCCKIRSTVYEILDKLNRSRSFFDSFSKLTRLEDQKNLATKHQLIGIADRIPVLLGYVEECFKLKGKANVLINPN